MCLKSIYLILSIASDGREVGKTSRIEVSFCIIYNLPMCGASRGSMKRNDPFMSDLGLKGSAESHRDLRFGRQQRYHVSELYGPA